MSAQYYVIFWEADSINPPWVSLMILCIPWEGLIPSSYSNYALFGALVSVLFLVFFYLLSSLNVMSSETPILSSMLWSFNQTTQGTGSVGAL
jgi:hypothetical protein